MSDFVQIMKRKSDLQLLEIVERDASKYAKEALDAAKNELAARTLSEDETLRARSQLDARDEKKTNRKNRLENIVGKVSNDALSETLDGVDHTVDRSRDIIIKLVVAYLGYNLFWMLFRLFNYFTGLGAFEVIMSLIFTPIIIIAVYGLLVGKRNGWIATVGFMSCLLAQKVGGLYFDIKTYFIYRNDARDFDNESSSTIMDLINGLLYGYMSPSLFLVLQFMGLVIVFFVIRYFLHPDICFKFKVSDPTKQKTVLTGFLSGLVFSFLIVWFYY